MESIKNGELKPDGDIVKENGEIKVTKVALEPVWYLLVSLNDCKYQREN